MPTHAELVERYSHAEIEELQTVISSQDYTDEAREIAREQLLARGIAGPAMRGAGFVVPDRGPTHAPVHGSPAGILAVFKVLLGVTIVVKGLVVLGLGVFGFASGVALESVQLALAGVAIVALGAMVVAPRVSIRWIGIAAIACAYLPLFADAIRLVRWAPVAIVATTTLLLLRTEREKSDAMVRATA